MNNEKEITSLGKLVVLHLLPGLVLSSIYILLSKLGILAEYPKLVVLGLSGVLSIIPVQLGILLYVAKKEEGSFNIFKILGLKSKMKLKEYIFYTISLFLVTGVILTIFNPLSDFILNRVFSWLPGWYNYNQDLTLFSKNLIIVTIFVSLFFFAIIGPVIEELYFRGFLLARMKWLGKYSVLVNVILFAIYHFWSPWLILTRIAAMLPLFYFVYKKDSLLLAILVHSLLNFTDVIALLMLL